MENLDLSSLKEALVLLGELLELEGAAPAHLVVVGGSALLVAGVVSRTTRDVDVIAQREIPEGALVPILQLSGEVKEAARKVARELGLAENWLNATTAIFTLPLEDYPAEVWQDMETLEFGKCLQVSFLGRLGLIHLKFYAAIDPDRARRKSDREDLQRLKPSEAEVLRVHAWMREAGLLSDARASDFIEVLHHIGHGELVSRMA